MAARIRELEAYKGLCECGIVKSARRSPSADSSSSVGVAKDVHATGERTTPQSEVPLMHGEE